MMLLSQAAFLDLARRFASAEEFARWQLENKTSLRQERAERRARLAGAVGLVESGLRVVSRTQSDVASTTVADPRPASAEGLEHPRVKLAIARKAVPWLPVPDNAKEVMAALLDFCGEVLRCGVGLDFIVKRLGRTGKDPRRHVRRGVSNLVEAGVLKVAAHAGMRHVNVYFPQWDKFAAIVAAFESGAGVRVQSDMGDKIVLQSQKKIPPSVTPRKVQRVVEPDRRQRQLPLVAVVPQGMPRERAGLRVMQAITAHCRGRSVEFARQVRADISSELLEAAISAEVRGKGGGIGVILEALGPGPPRAWDGEVSDSLRAVLKRG